MRLWAKQLIPYLPKLQLLSQWRECCAICSNWANKGTPNHLLVNKVMNYPSVHFMEYTRLIVSEIIKRDYKVNAESQNLFIKNFERFGNSSETIISANVERVIFEGWHDKRYLRECLFNLEEKAMCNGIPKDEWEIIYDKFGKEFDLWEGED